MRTKRQHPASNCIIIIFIQITSNDSSTLILEITSIGTLFGFIGILYGCPKGSEAMASPCGAIFH